MEEKTSMIRKGRDEDFEEIFNVINDAAMAYKGVIPPDRWHEPYMTRAELKKEIKDGIRFLCYVDNDPPCPARGVAPPNGEISTLSGELYFRTGEIIGVMGIQDKSEVDLIRHAYVRTEQRNKGIGSLLLQELLKGSKKPVLVGTWKAAHWAIRFYEKHGFSLVSEEDKNRLLKKYWKIPDRQVETSVVLVDEKYKWSKDF